MGRIVYTPRCTSAPKPPPSVRATSPEPACPTRSRSTPASPGWPSRSATRNWPPLPRTCGRPARTGPPRCGLSLLTASHGMLSRAGSDGPRVEEERVAAAQILAVDEAHNFLNRESNRTRQVRRSRADHVLLFTATPINRGPGDLLALVNLLGADNFTDSTLDTLTRLAQRRTAQQALTAEQHQHLRSEIARFTVRRTKAVLNQLVDRDPDAYRHPDTARTCRYPVHDSP